VLAGKDEGKEDITNGQSIEGSRRNVFVKLFVPALCAKRMFSNCPLLMWPIIWKK
jgi:hypothetical protein